MRRRVVREIGTLLGIAAILSGIVLFNYLTRQQSLKEKMIAWRIQIEGKRESKGLELLPWSLLQKTTGNVRRGPTFDEALLAWDGKMVDLIGFQVPIESFREMVDFILLPMPIECYFCESPPMRDVVLVQMKQGETAQLFKEPILINGRLKLNKGPDTKFFYVIEDTTFGPGEEKGKLTRKVIDSQHATHLEATKYVEGMEKEGLMPGETPPSATDDQPAPKELTGDEFLAENMKKEGVVVLPSGLQYKVVREGVGRSPLAADKVKVDYRGTLIDGKEFDSSYSRGKPEVFGVTQVIPGWTEALMLMKEGAKWELYIPSGLAYGAKGAGGAIPPNAALIFEVELIEVINPS